MPIEAVTGIKTFGSTMNVPENAAVFKVMLWDDGMYPYAFDSTALENAAE